MDEKLEVSLRCDPCGLSACIENVTSPMHAQGLLDAWSSAHKHTDLELKMYHDNAVALRQYEIDKEYEVTEEGDD